MAGRLFLKSKIKYAVSISNTRTNSTVSVQIIISQLVKQVSTTNTPRSENVTTVSSNVLN